MSLHGFRGVKNPKHALGMGFHDFEIQNPVIVRLLGSVTKLHKLMNHT